MASFNGLRGSFARWQTPVIGLAAYGKGACSEGTEGLAA
jgi:hypothetical protein